MFPPKQFGRGLSRLAASLVLVAPLWLAAPALSQQDYSIAAVVNEDLITAFDVQARMRLLLSISGIENTEESRRRLAPQAMRSLIDERLQLQEAARLNLTVTDQEITEALAVITRQNRLPPGGLEERLRSEGIPISTLLGQLRATLAWNKVIRRQIRPQVDVTEEEVDEFLDKLKARGGATEYDVAEIFIPIDSSADERTAALTAQRVTQQARQGVPFASLAQQFSQSSSAGSGGDLGAVQEGQLDRRLDNALQQMQPGTVSDPIRVENGFYVLQLKNRKQRTAAAAPSVSTGGADETVALRRIYLPVSKAAPANEVKTQGNAAASVSESVKDCADMDRMARQVKASGAVDIGRLRTADLPPRIRGVIERLPVGKASPPIQIEDGFVVLMVCERGRSGSTPVAAAPGGAGLPDREEVIRSLGSQRIEMLARRYMRDLRRDAFIDIRA